MNIVVVSSTPRVRGNSDILADRTVAGAMDAGAAVEKIRLNTLTIGPCTACDACQDAPETACIIDDDAGPLLETLRSSDAIVLASPIYFFSPSAQLKLLLDRTYALGGGSKWDALAGRKFAAIFTYADEDPVDSGVFNAIGTIRDAGRFLKLDLVGVVHASCSGEGEILENEEALESAFALGRKLAG